MPQPDGQIGIMHDAYLGNDTPRPEGCKRLNNMREAGSALSRMWLETMRIWRVADWVRNEPARALERLIRIDLTRSPRGRAMAAICVRRDKAARAGNTSPH